MRYLLLLLLPLSCFAQFGGFRTDLPFLAASATDSGTQPDSLPNLVFWFKADAFAYKDNGTTLCTNNDTVYLWKDNSANHYDLSQSTSGNRPQYKENQLGGKPAIYFNDKYLGVASGFSAPATVLMVFKMATRDIGVDYWTMIGSSSTANSEFIFQGSAGVNVSLIAGSAGGKYVTAPNCFEEVWYYATAWGKSAVVGERNSHIRTNGVFVADGNINEGWPVTATALRLGRNAYLQDHNALYIAELIIYSDQLSTNNIEGVELYLKNKYGL